MFSSLYVAAAAAFLSGAAVVLSFAPFGLYPVAVIALAVFYGTLVGRGGRNGFLLG